jgi:hypothetical protein
MRSSRSYPAGAAGRVRQSGLLYPFRRRQEEVLWGGKSSRARRSAILRACSNCSGCYSWPSGRGCARARTSCSRTCSCAINSPSSPARRAPDRVLGLVPGDKLLWVVARRFCAGWREHLAIVAPDTVVRWHPRGWRLFWRWTSRSRGGRPHLSPEARELIATISRENRLWGTERIRGELLKLGIVVSNRSIRR